MPLPQLGHTYAQERRGISAVQRYAADRDQIFRETQTGDVGIDGQLEFVRADGSATGQTIALQVKSGPSFFAHPTDQGWKFYPEQKHRSYWEGYPLPVLLVLHDPDNRRTYWVDARQALRSPSTAERAYIEVPRINHLEETTPIALFQSAGTQNAPYIKLLPDVFQALVNRRSANGSFPISFLDLFCGGLTNICRSIYFGTDIALSIVEANLDAVRSPFGWGMGQPEHDFLFDFVKFLLSQHLAEVNFSDCLIDLVDRDMTPTFIAPLTPRGRQLVDLIQAEEKRLVEAGLMPDAKGYHVAQEAFVEMVSMSFGPRLHLFHLFQSALKESVANPKPDA